MTRDEFTLTRDEFTSTREEFTLTREEFTLTRDEYTLTRDEKKLSVYKIIFKRNIAQQICAALKRSCAILRLPCAIAIHFYELYMCIHILILVLKNCLRVNLQLAHTMFTKNITTSDLIHAHVHLDV